MISKLWLVFASCVLLALPSCSSLDPAFLTALNSSWEKIKSPAVAIRRRLKDRPGTPSPRRMENR